MAILQADSKKIIKEFLLNSKNWYINKNKCLLPVLGNIFPIHLKDKSFNIHVS